MNHQEPCSPLLVSPSNPPEPPNLHLQNKPTWPNLPPQIHPVTLSLHKSGPPQPPKKSLLPQLRQPCLQTLANHCSPLYTTRARDTQSCGTWVYNRRAARAWRCCATDQPEATDSGCRAAAARGRHVESARASYPPRGCRLPPSAPSCADRALRPVCMRTVRRRSRRAAVIVAR